jgi:hypothetical protein
MPEPYRAVPTFAGGNWYEEDCDWALVALSFPELFIGTGAMDAARALEPTFFAKRVWA